MPPFALFEIVVSLLRGASQSNNAKSGTGVVEARIRVSLRVHQFLIPIFRNIVWSRLVIRLGLSELNSEMRGVKT